MALYEEMSNLSMKKKFVSKGGGLYAAFGGKKELGPDGREIRPAYFCPAELILAAVSGGNLSPNNGSGEFEFRKDKEGGCYVETKDRRIIVYFSEEDIDIIKQEYDKHIHQNLDVSKILEKPIEIGV